MDKVKKLAIINAVPYGSTGKIVRGIDSVARQKGMETVIFYSWTKRLRKSNAPNVVVTSFFGKLLHMALARFTGKNGGYSFKDTKKIIKHLEKFKPDAINLHIMHSWNINLPMLFDYVKKNDIPVIWTMHDCWAFTGHCPCFDMIGCYKWKTGCFECPQYKDYPNTYFDRSEKMWRLKREWFTGIKNMTLVTPSEWMCDTVKQSFLSEYPVKVINNGIDLTVFKPTESDFRKKYNCEGKYILLGVAFDWSVRKGLDVFIELAKRLDDEYQIVLVGTNDEIDKSLPKNIISIHKTENQAELAKIYSASDLFINPTREDNFPTVNMESIACGLPLITFKTGGSIEIFDEGSGLMVDKDDIDGMERAIRQVRKDGGLSREECILRSKKYDQNERFTEYVDLIQSML
ncbi:MAG: glycosyltransferase [Clostridia bacterium]|nr:glycosyltransferase [Clostridia bacterium]